MPNHFLKDLINCSSAQFVCGDINLCFNFLHFDSRLIQKNCGFLAMVGESQDGHDYIDKAIENGANLIIAEKKVKVASHVTLVIAKSALDVLQTYAKWYRETKLKTYIIGITGSVGKTSTKDCMSQLIGQDLCYSSEGNYNNFLGLPICLLKMEENQKYGIFEAGISTPNEMELLGKILQPNMMIVTNIFQSHMEFFDSHSKLVKEKLKLSKQMRTGSILILPKKYEQEARDDLKVITFDHLIPQKKQIEKIGFGPSISFELSKIAIKYLEIEVSLDNEIAMTPLRMQRCIKKGQNFLLDCYNASPESMSALFLSVSNVNECIFILGDMLELGVNKEEVHLRVLSDLLKLKPKKICLFGEIFSKAYEKLEKNSIDIKKYQRIDDVISELHILESECIVIKGSRFFALEKIYQKY
ncbi:MAG: hypothetical protein COB02_04040 [Candidatus Cloacimonadota bacterium]|nr:MAG: hypothetical protein COB02_04040 [Candidatus Cloacimonadota bacterium]